ncbi:putative bifunctional diguanylate cyclase/phosphodiesterase [Sphingomonas sp. PAMC 26621]|uniref:putative bifunctional diguanylate cyclase/phosphodiesterase n=1 Tax=Sphingomonas sp. PAMC 26621 TaxID=1112213 RepID=UPI0002892C05|nr:EAL domain-containing protein [Sphingomonas sp. PAMC 26621]
MRTTDEVARLDALRQLNLLDTPASESFDRITRMAAQIFGVPVAAVSLTDSDRQWFKSRVGVAEPSMPRADAPCSQVVETAGMVIIPDLATDPVYADSTIGRKGFRFYAGAPLITADGHGLGALCVLGTEPHAATEPEIKALRDLAAMVMAQIEMQHSLGRTDPVTGLPNRLQFFENFDDLARENPGQLRFVALIDLARGDQVDSLIRVLGTNFIDEFVKLAARTVAGLIGTHRTLYHVGETQFALISEPGHSLDSYYAILEAGVKASVVASSARLVTTLTAGIAPVTLGTMRSRDALRAAHSAAQDARNSEGAIGVFSPAMDGPHLRNFDLLRAFGTALEQDDELCLAYQPRIDLATGRCIGAEALLRWCHPTLGDVSPAEFIPVIENTALARATTAFVLDTGLAQVRAWQVAGLRVPLAINISAANLEEEDFALNLQLLLAKHQVPAAMVELELTESAVMADGDNGLARLEALRAIGVRIAIDDFGTGHSSLAYLQRLPAQIIKIDQSFVRGMGEGNARDRILVRTMISLARQLGLQVVAEGVETAAVDAALAAMGCEEAQGYFYARPLAADVFATWYRRFNATPRPAHRAA